MVKGIFDKHEAGKESQRESRMPLAATPTESGPANQTAGSIADQPADEAFFALTRELSGLGEMEVSRAAKERGWAALERESKARNLAAHLADLVVTRNTAGARALVASDAQASLAQMMATLKDLSTYELTDSGQLPGDLTWVTVLIKDRARKGRSRPREVSRRFAIKVRVTSLGAVVTAIDAICQKPWPREPR